MALLTGRLLMPSDMEDDVQGPAALYTTAGSLVQTITSGDPATGVIPYCSVGDVLPSGIWCVAPEFTDAGNKGLGNVESIAVYGAASTTLIANLTSLITTGTTFRVYVSAAATDAHTFYVAVDNGTAILVSTVSDAGVIGGTTWTLTGTAGTLEAFTVNAAGTIAYYITLDTSPKKIRRWDLTNNVALSDLVTFTESPGFDTLKVLPDGSIAVIVTPTVPGTWVLRQYTTSGTLLNSLSLGPTNQVPEIGADPTDTTHAWVKFFNSAVTIATLDKLTLADLSVATTWDVGTLSGTGPAPVSCPLLVFPGTSSASITVTKNAGTDTTTSFPFTAGGGLSPTTFSLTGGASQVFSTVAAGTYSISETTQTGWLPAAYHVSNGNSASAITVASGDAVTVTVTNTARPSGSDIRVSRRLRRFPLPFEANVYQFLSRLEILIQSGVGLATGQGSDPVIMCRISRDGGQTWGYELTMGLGKQGEYSYRAYLNRLGRGRNFVVELTTSDPVFVAILAAYADLETGTA